MRRYRMCRFLALAALIAVQALAAQHPLRAQFEPERPHASLVRMPSLVFELWPADFNGDGITDLVGGRSGGDVVVRIGRGDGTFGDEQVIAAALGMPIGVGDLNHDGRIDVVASAAPSGDHTVWILPGNGDGTFAAPILPGLVLRAPGYVIDVDGDGTHDLVGLDRGDAIRLYPGRRDFTFAPPVVLRTGIMVQHLLPVDLNGDGLVDLAAITLDSRSIDLFLNAGALTFTSSSLPIGLQGLGLTARDVNGDGLVDLIASAGELRAYVAAPTWVSGFVLVLLGHGDGTFGEPRAFPTNNGPRSVVAGDFNGDGLTDVATGNLSYAYAYPCETFNHLWDSVSMLPGRGDGSFGPPASYSLGNSEGGLDAVLYRRAHHRLTTSDLNADGRTDLIASPGAILLATPPSENRGPVVNAGEPRWAPSSESMTLFGTANDPDNDWLTFEWTDAAGQVVGRVPRPCVKGYAGEQAFTLTVSDGRGGVSIDSVVHTFGPRPPLPPGWTGADIGSPSVPGGSSFDGSTYAITGGGADIWGTADAFHYVSSSIAGDFDVSVRVTGVQYVHDWTKAGLMIREGLDAGARHAFVLATPSSLNGVAFQRREVAGDVSVHTAGPGVAPPVWLRLTREGDVINAFARSGAGDEWVFIDTQTLTGLPHAVQVGMAVTSHADAAVATAYFDSFVITPIEAPLPDGWTSEDVGSVGAAGRSSYDGATFTVRGAGADVWDTVDAFHYSHTTVSGDFDIEVRIASLEPVHEWTKAGLMMRDGLSPLARHAFVFATPGNGVAFQRREIAGAATGHTAGLSAGAPVSLRLRRQGETVSAYARTAVSSEWELIGTQTFADLPTSMQLGLAVTSHIEGTTATAVFDDLQPSSGSLPPGWTSRDIGVVAAPGSATYLDGTFSVRGSGEDIWQSSDSFHYAYTTFVGDFTVVVRVLSLDGTHPWAKAGLMVREGLSPQARHASAFVTPGNGVAFQYRDAFAGDTRHIAGATSPAPVWLRIDRDGAELITYYRIGDETQWTAIGTRNFVSMSEPLLVGLAVTSHADGTVATARFDNLRTPADVGAAWTSAEIGNPGVTGFTETLDGDTFTMRAGGADIWETSDAFRFTHQPLSGDGSVTARVADLWAGHAWAKAGVMIRSSLNPSSAHAFAFVSLSEGLAFQRRLRDGDATVHTAGAGVSAPHWVRLTRTGDTITAFSSADGVTWVEIGRDAFPSMPRDVLAGIAVTSHDDTMLATAMFDRLLVESSGLPSVAVVWPDAKAFNKRLKVLHISSGTEEHVQGARTFDQKLDQHGIKHVYYESPGTAHEWQTWRRSLNGFAPLLFR